MSLTIKSAIQALTGRIADAYTAISQKGGTLPATQDSANLPTAIASIPSGIADEPELKDVAFIDYDGKIIASYTYDEFESITQPPTPPTHDGLTFVQWTNTIAELKTYKKRITISGAMYKPTDDCTHIFIYTIRANQTFAFKKYAAGGIIDWGDGTTDSNPGASVSHQYTLPGKYEIKISSSDWTHHKGIAVTDTNSRPFLLELWFADVLAQSKPNPSDSAIGADGLGLCANLRAIVAPIKAPIINGVLYACTCLKALITKMAYYKSFNESGLMYVTFWPQYNSGNVPNACYQLRRINFPTELESMPNYATNYFSYCRSLEYIWFNLDAGVYGVQHDVSCKEMHLPWSTPPSLGNSSYFTNVPTTCIMYVKRGTLNAYETATNWSTIYAQYTFIEED